MGLKRTPQTREGLMGWYFLGLGAWRRAKKVVYHKRCGWQYRFIGSNHPFLPVVQPWQQLGKELF